jgi:hypothetical protein
MLTRSVVLATTLTVGLVAGVGSSAIAVAVLPGDASGATQLVEAIASPTQDPAEGSHAWFIESTPVTLTIAKPLVIDGGDSDSDEPAAKVDPANEHDPATTPSPSPSASDSGTANGNSGSNSGNSTSPSNSGSTLEDKAKDDKAKEDKAKKDRKAAEEQAKKAAEEQAKKDKKAAEEQAKKDKDDKAKKDKDDKAKKDKDQSDGAESGT